MNKKKLLLQTCFENKKELNKKYNKMWISRKKNKPFNEIQSMHLGNYYLCATLPKQYVKIEFRLQGRFSLKD